MSVLATVASQPWAPPLGWALIHFLWQGALIAALYATARTGVRQARARYLLACAALLTMIAAPLLALTRRPSSPLLEHLTLSPATQPARSEWSTAPIATVVPVTSSWPDSLLPWLVIAWFTGSCGFSLRLLAGWTFTMRVRSAPAQVAPHRWRKLLRALSDRIRVSRHVSLLTSAQVEVPTLIGWLRPAILLPIGALAGLPAAHIEAILAHELAHIRRHDYLVNMLQSIAESMLFYHPAVWWISGHLRQEREYCCDETAASIVGGSLIYAQALAGLEAFRPAHRNPALAATGGPLKQRIARLLDPDLQTTRRPVPVAALSLLFCIVVTVLAQTPPPAPAFEVASIKPSPPEYAGFQSYVRGDRYTAMTATVYNLMSYAYGIRDFQISGGPGWASSVGYNISAKMASPSTPNLSRQMLQTLLAERFGLRFHRITRNVSGFALVVDKNGPKLTESKNPGLGLGLGRGRLTGRGADMQTLTQQLSSQMEVPIANRTGLTALYDFALAWSADAQASDPSDPSLFTALKEQLGLRLEPVKDVPSEFFVIERVHRPTEN